MTLTNILENATVSLIYFVPGRTESLRVNGRARITTEPAVLAPVAAYGKPPQTALVVAVERAWLHCGRALIRSRLWEPGSCGVFCYDSLEGPPRIRSPDHMVRLSGWVQKQNAAGVVPVRITPEISGRCAGRRRRRSTERRVTFARFSFCSDIRNSKAPCASIRSTPRGTGLQSTLRWREPDSNHRSRSCLLAPSQRPSACQHRLAER